MSDPKDSLASVEPMLRSGGAQSGPSVSARDKAIAQYLQTGDWDVHLTGWDRGTVIERGQQRTADLKQALLAEIRRRAPRAPVPEQISSLDVAAFAREKLTPMVTGLFPESERESVLQVFDRAIVFLTPENIEQAITETTWPNTAWEVANLYLHSIEAAQLGDSRVEAVGLTVGTTCYVSMEYSTSTDLFADYVVHEAAHVFHLCKRRSVGIPERRRSEWLLDIDYRKRETFAYACEAYSRVLELGKSRAERVALVEQLAGEPMPSDERMDPAEYLDILREAVRARNGWKRILMRCAPPVPMRVGGWRRDVVCHPGQTKG